MNCSLTVNDGHTVYMATLRKSPISRSDVFTYNCVYVFCQSLPVSVNTLTNPHTKLLTGLLNED